MLASSQLQLHGSFSFDSQCFIYEGLFLQIKFSHASVSSLDERTEAQ